MSPLPASLELPPLPIDAQLAGIEAALRDANSLVLTAPPGAGKTTRVPPLLARGAWSREGRIIVLEPRRMAARAAAKRVAYEQRVPVGEAVGYAVRFDEKQSRATRILFVTEGVFLRMLQGDPFLEGAAAVVFDEFHERNLLSDIALGMVRRLQTTVRPDLRSVIMSATLDGTGVASRLGCPHLASEGRAFPVEIRRQPRASREPLSESMAAVIERALRDHAGDLLAFFPGVGEIHRTASLLEALARRDDLAVMPLYGDMPPEEQDAVLAPSSRRKVVLATNVAETSLTIEGVTIVVDSGLAKVMRFDPASGLDRLELSPISKASAEQRRGRAGRTQPGVCWQLWDEAAHRARPERETPEVQRVDLAGAVLLLKDWGEQDVQQFPWLDPPSPEGVARAEHLLERLGALADGGQPTPLGRTLARMPLHPRLARLLSAAHAMGDVEHAALLAAFLSERDPFMSSRRSPGGRPVAASRTVRSRSDVVDRVLVLQRVLDGGAPFTPFGEVHPGGQRTLRQVCDQLLRQARADLGESPSAAAPVDEILMRALLAAYPDRVARRRDRGSDRGAMVGGRGVKLAPSSCVTVSELFLCVDVSDQQPDALVRLASSIERDWLPEELLSTRDELFFHPSQKQVVARRRVQWDDLVLGETPIALPEGARTAEVLFAAARPQMSLLAPREGEAAEFLERLRSLGAWRPELELPAADEAFVQDVLRELCEGRRSFAELQSAPWLWAFKNRLTSDQLKTVDREAPERLALPSGRSFRLQYQAGRPPVLAARIQELFGCQETPRIAGGRVKVLVHLLAPNMRPQQVTDDLPSFWANGYPVVRKELKRRYPKHAWPEEPRAAD